MNRRTTSATVLREDSPTPSVPLGSVLERLGVNLYAPKPVQYVAWAQKEGLFRIIDGKGAASMTEIVAEARLNANGADAILGVLCALGLAKKSRSQHYSLTTAAQEYLLPDSPYFVGTEIKSKVPIPTPYVESSGSLNSRIWNSLRRAVPLFRFGSMRRLQNQHARNLPSCTVAARSTEFSTVNCMIDIAGGSGAFAIPLALKYPDMRIVLTDLPQAMKHIARIIARHNLSGQIELRAMNVLRRPWRVPRCDGMFIGNLLHGFDDSMCRLICGEAINHLVPGGRLWVHEMLWNDTGDASLVTALANATVRCNSGRQRTGIEIQRILACAGFEGLYSLPTAMPFSLIVGRKPE